MDKLTLKGLSFHALHGYYEEEKENGNTFEVDLIFKLDLSEAGRSDILSSTIDYSKARDLVEEVMRGPSMDLIESLTMSIGDRIFETFQPSKLTVKVRKLHPPMKGESLYSEVSMKWPR